MSDGAVRALTFEEYFESGGTQRKKTPVRATHPPAPSSHGAGDRARSSAGAAYDPERRPRTRLAGRRGASPTPEKARSAPGRGRRRDAMDAQTTARRSIDNIIEGLSKGSRLSETEQLRLFEQQQVDAARLAAQPAGASALAAI